MSRLLQLSSLVRARRAGCSASRGSSWRSLVVLYSSNTISLSILQLNISIYTMYIGLLRLLFSSCNLSPSTTTNTTTSAFVFVFVSVRGRGRGPWTWLWPASVLCVCVHARAGARALALPLVLRLAARAHGLLPLAPESPPPSPRTLPVRHPHPPHL